ncbi:hypothetical protein HDV00_001134 [Rhizophlyctis rosea]|nr:hypothetical protein HDV00_001134 [Rhizophlyctis rosea]
MLEDERFPLCEYFHQNSYNPVVDLFVLKHPEVAKFVTFPDILDRVHLYMLEPQILQVLRTLYDKAPSSQKVIFQRHLQHLLCNNPKWAFCEASVRDFIGAIPPETSNYHVHRLRTIMIASHNLHDLRRAIRTSAIDTVEALISGGVTVNHKHMFYDLSHIMKEQLSLEGWCQALSLLLTRQPNLEWCADDPEQYMPVLSSVDQSKTNLDSLLIQTLWCMFRAGPTREVFSKYQCTAVTEHFAKLEALIRGGQIPWFPVAEHCLDSLETLRRKYYGHGAARFVSLLEWLVERDPEWTEERQEISRRKREDSRGWGSSSDSWRIRLRSVEDDERSRY